MSNFINDNNISNTLGTVNIPKGDNIKINTSSYNDNKSNINYNYNGFNPNEIDNVNFEDFTIDSDVMMIYHGEAVKKEYVDASKEEVEEIKKIASKIAENMGNRVDSNKIVEDMGIEEYLVNYMIENNTTEIPEEILKTINLKIVQAISTSSRTGDIAVPDESLTHGEMTETEIEKLKKLLESGSLPEDEAEKVRKIIEEYENRNQ